MQLLKKEKTKYQEQDGGTRITSPVKNLKASGVGRFSEASKKLFLRDK